MSNTDGFFDDDIADEVDRNGAGDPLIMQPDGKRLAYTRASSLGDYVAETKYLQQWQLRYLARQMGKNEDLAAMAAVESYSTGFDEDSVTKSASGKRLDGYIQRAFDRGRMDERADYGSVVHALTEPGSEGYVPIRAAIDVHAFWECVVINEVEILGTELFVVNDRLRAAGTFDHLVRTKQHGVCIADKKTGRNISGLGFAVQFVTYADGLLYSPRTQERIGPLTDLTGGEPVNKDVALLFEVHDGLARIREVDISRGRLAAEWASRVRDARAWNGMANISKVYKQVKTGDSAVRQRAIIRRIREARHAEELTGIWYHYGTGGTGDWPADREHPISKAAAAKKQQEGWK